jgi:Protein of unknown function (DUF3551)
MMRGLVWMILGIGMIFAVSPASAQWLETKYPVCMEVYGSRGARIECVFWSMEQCWASADGIAALCFTNRYYVPVAPKAQWSPAHPRRFQPDH